MKLIRVKCKDTIKEQIDEVQLKKCLNELEKALPSDKHDDTKVICKYGYGRLKIDVQEGYFEINTLDESKFQNIVRKYFPNWKLEVKVMRHGPTRERTFHYILYPNNK